MKKLNKILSFLLIALFAFSFVKINVSDAVTAISVKVNPNIVTLAAQYDISFVTGKELRGSYDDWVRIDFPNDFFLPCNCGGTGWSRGDFLINGVSPSDTPEGSNTSNQKYVKIYLPSGMTIGAGKTVRIRIKSTAKVRNPNTPGQYKLGIYTSQEATESYSKPFPIVFSHVKNVMASLTSDVIDTTTGVAVSFKTGELGDLGGTTGSNTIPDSISVVFPDGFYVPDFIGSNYVNIRVNGVNSAPAKTTVSGNTVTCTVKNDIKANTSVTVEISESAGIKTPDKPGMYKLQVHTSKEKTNEPSNAIEIKDKPYVRTKLILTPAFPDGKNDFYITQPIAILIGETNTGDPVSTFYRIDNGNYQSSVSGAQIVIPYGIHKLYYYSEAGNITEKEKIKTIKFDNVSPILTINAPENNSYAKSSKCTVKGSVKEDYLDYVSVNGNKVQVDNSGNFSLDVNLVPGKNTIKIVAEDLAGNKDEKDINITYDTTVPEVTITSPKNWQEFNDPNITVTGTVKPVDNVSLTINGENVDVRADGTFVYNLTVDKPGLFSIKAVVMYTLSGKTSESDVVIVYKPIKKITILLKIDSKTIFIDGKQSEMDVAPFIEPSTGRTLVPIRFISEAFGAEVKWEPQFKVVDIRSGKTVIKLQIGNKIALVNGEQVELDQPPLIKDNRTMVPLRFISEAFGAEVKWFPETREIKIIYEKKE